MRNDKQDYLCKDLSFYLSLSLWSSGNTFDYVVVTTSGTSSWWGNKEKEMYITLPSPRPCDSSIQHIQNNSSNSLPYEESIRKICLGTKSDSNLISYTSQYQKYSNDWTNELLTLYPVRKDDEFFSETI